MAGPPNGAAPSLPASISSIMATIVSDGQTNQASLAAALSSLHNAATQTTSTIATTTDPVVASITPTISSQNAQSTTALVLTSNQPQTSEITQNPQASQASTNTVNPDSSQSVTSTIPGSPSTFTTSTLSSNAASSSGVAAGAITKDASSHGLSPGVAAAIAVPITLIALGVIIFFIVFARRRRRSDGASESGGGGGGGGTSGSKWTRHLRVFSFDAELLMGARSSASNSMRSGPSSVRVAPESIRSGNHASVRSLESPAPPYRASLMSQVRPASTGTAPPPYLAAAILNNQSRAGTVRTARSDPFRDPEDDEAVSPVVDRPSVARRGSSTYQSVRGDDDFSFVSTLAESEDAGSIREAQVARNVSGRGRTITDVRDR